MNWALFRILKILFFSAAFTDFWNWIQDLTEIIIEVQIGIPKCLDSKMYMKIAQLGLDMKLYAQAK